MKKIIILCITLFIPFFSFTQIKSDQSGTIKVSKKKPLVIVMPEKMKVLYIGVDNPLTIAACAAGSSEITVSITNGTITGSNGNYIAHVTGGKTATVNVYEKIDGEKKMLLDSVVFRIKTIPRPIVMAAGKRDGDLISVNELSSAAGIVPELENFDFDISFKIISFDLTYLNGGVVFSLTSGSNSFTQEMKTGMASLKPGNKLYIENIKCCLPDGSVMMLSSVQLKIR